MLKKSKSNLEPKSNGKIHTRSGLIYHIVCLAVYLAFFLIAGVSVFLGYIPFGPTQLTYLPLIVAIATVHLGFNGSLISGLGFGFSSFIAAFILGVIKYQNFDLSVIPRVMMSLVVYLIYILINMKNKPKMWKFLILILAATFLNTTFVLGSQYFHNKFIGELKGILPPLEWMVAHTVNLIAEPIFNLLIGLAAYLPLLEIRKKYLERLNLSW
ncbi:hypothetical protein KQ874_01990 [Mycoplasma sp. ES3157-GEN-MYC]|uniref:Uncharacterized protein n=1 Tax=Mycoplasma miroungigenitalium TaxID=754515 RepID=A0A6M4J975_9MOLU|nr:hypothetical protein [Mycoplasma miroungigenitalium]MBU4690459.1 hypothetical protein [Mycoplasma miroungigenitalium]MBU4691726.1 hypothetical protein [Mycoplasma miroungigenitalium]QJR43554.1 hypothetical protein HLA87_01995 [Mycoplasma miroungigenitalium]